MAGLVRPSSLHSMGSTAFRGDQEVFAPFGHPLGRPFGRFSPLKNFVAVPAPCKFTLRAPATRWQPGSPSTMNPSDTDYTIDWQHFLNCYLHPRGEFPDGLDSHIVVGHAVMTDSPEFLTGYLGFVSEKTGAFKTYDELIGEKESLDLITVTTAMLKNPRTRAKAQRIKSDQVLLKRITQSIAMLYRLRRSIHRKNVVPLHQQPPTDLGSSRKNCEAFLDHRRKRKREIGRSQKYHRPDHRKI